MTTRTTPAVPCLLLIVIAMLPACRGDVPSSTTAPPVDANLVVGAPDPSGGAWARYYPLEIGNQWRYEWRHRMWEGDGTVRLDREGELTSEIIGMEEFFGRMYVVEEQHETYDEGDAFTWIRYRQDRDGLYEAEVSITQPPALIGAERAAMEKRPEALAPAAGTNRELLPHGVDSNGRVMIDVLAERHRRLVAAGLGRVIGTAEEGEITRMPYPLRPGEIWSAFSELNSEMEGHELLHLPIGNRVGARIRITLSEDAYTLVWYSRCGLLRIYHYSETGIPGQPLYTEYVLELVDSDVTGRPSCGR